MTLSIATAVFSVPALAEVAADESDNLPPLVIEINAPLIETRWMESPSGVTLIDDSDIVNGRVLLQPTDALNLSPGVLVQNRNNFAQNPRVSIRGFGARAPFGVRGIRVRLDGIPLTTVDGQAQTDAIDPSSVQTIEVLRAANAVLHGNGSGGLLDYRSYAPTDSPFARVDAQAGGFGLRRLHAALSQQNEIGDDKRYAYRLAASGLKQQGYRDQSEVERGNAGLWLQHGDADSEWFAILNHVDNPLAEDPGALNAEELAADRSQAAPLASTMNAGQQVTQNIASLGVVHRFDNRHALRVQGWTINRDFQQQLPFPGDSLIQYDRQIVGGVLDYEAPIVLDNRDDLTLQAQLSLEDQEDDRQRYCRNTDLEAYQCRDGITTDLALDQLEQASNVGIGLQLAIPVFEQRGRWVLGIRNDQLRMEIEDKLQASGIDNSGQRDYDETNYSLGYSHALDARWSAYSQYATSFEAPTFTEFANPQGSGFRPGLVPQSSQTFELGIRGQQAVYQVEATVFTVRVEDEIIVDDDPGAAPEDERTFYRNADRTRRDGVELGGRWWPGALPRLQLSGAVTWMDARFDGESDNTLPGLPDWTAFVDAEQRFQQGYFAGLSAQYIGRRYADDANSVEVASQTVTDLRLGYEIQRSLYNARLLIGIENLFDSEYLDNLRINARFGRYYEPGSERRIYAGAEISWF